MASTQRLAEVLTELATLAPGRVEVSPHTGHIAVRCGLYTRTRYGNNSNAGKPRWLYQISPWGDGGWYLHDQDAELRIEDALREECNLRHWAYTLHNQELGPHRFTAEVAPLWADVKGRGGGDTMALALGLAVLDALKAGA
jgi:hypothetical protein